MKDQDEDIREFLNNLPDKFDIVEDGIDIQIQKEYLDYSHSFDNGELADVQTLKLVSFLFDTNQPLEAKKKVLTLLAHLGTITAYRQIEKYYNLPDNGLKEWTAMALQECKMFLESMLTDQSKGLILSGLGGYQDKMRFFFLILPISEKGFTSAEKNIMDEEFKLVAKAMNSVVESVNLAETFIGLTVLIPMDVAVGTFIETGIKNCNEIRDFVFEHYYVTNMNIPDDAEIDEIIKIVKSD